MGPGLRRDDGRPQPPFGLLGVALLGAGLNSFFRSSLLCESRGHSQEKEFFAQLEALIRAACLTGLATGTGILSTSVRNATCCTARCGSCCCCSCCCCCLAVKAAAMLLRRWLSR